MSNHLAMRSGNPALQASTFKKHLTSSVEGKMTLSGTVNKTGISLLLVIISAGYTWGNPGMHIMMIPAGIVGFILALATVFKPNIGHITVPAYAVAHAAVPQALVRPAPLSQTFTLIKFLFKICAIVTLHFSGKIS